MFRKRLVVFLILVLGFSCFFNIKVSASTKAKINSTDIKLYTLSESAKTSGVAIPNDLKTSFKLEISGTNIVPTYTISNEDQLFINISSDGVITTREEYSTDNGAYSMTDKVCHISVLVGNETFDVKVTIIDYLNIYVKEKMQAIIKENITSSMNEYEKAETIAKYIVDNYEYSTNPNFRYVFLNGSGDCIALNSIFIQLCEQLNIKAHIRYAGDLPSTGAGHHDVVALLDGKIYYVDVSYFDPRDYVISDRPFGLNYDGNGFLYYFLSSNGYLALAKYDGFNTENIKITPKITVKMIDGPKEYDLKVIGEDSFSNTCKISGVKVKSVIIPEGVETIEDNAFSDCTSLQKVSLPSTLKNIEKLAFLNTDIKEFSIDSNNPYYTFENGILYNKNKTEVIYVSPSLEGELTLPSSIKTIKAYAFAYNKNLTGVILNSNLETIEEHAFDHSNIYGLTISKSVKTIGNDAFAESNLRYIKIEDGSTLTLSDYIFENAINLNGVYIPKSISNIETNAFRFASNDLTMYVLDNSNALNYAKNNNKNYEIVSNSTTITQSMIILKNTSYDYDGTEKTPEVMVLNGGKVLKLNSDYTYSYKNNINSSPTPAVIVTGKNTYSGTAEKNFKINRIMIDTTIEVEDIVYGEILKPQLITNNKEVSCTYRYGNEPNFYTSSQIAPTEVGTYYLLAAISPEDRTNYYSHDIWVKYNILPAENELDVSCNDVVYGQKIKINVLKNKAAADLTYYYKKADADDSTYSTTEPTEPGEYTLKVVSSATKNYKETSITKNFQILKESYLKGDINSDTKVDLLDVREALAFAVGKHPVTDKILLLGDMDINGKMTSIDATQILKIYLRKN